MVFATVREQSSARAEVEALSQRLHVTEEAVTGFLGILNERAVPLEKLPET